MPPFVLVHISFDDKPPITYAEPAPVNATSLKLSPMMPLTGYQLSPPSSDLYRLVRDINNPVCVSAKVRPTYSLKLPIRPVSTPYHDRPPSIVFTTPPNSSHAM